MFTMTALLLSHKVGARLLCLVEGAKEKRLWAPFPGHTLNGIRAVSSVHSIGTERTAVRLR